MPNPFAELMALAQTLRDKDAKHLGELTAACPVMTVPARLVREFAEFLTPTPGNDTALTTIRVRLR